MKRLTVFAAVIAVVMSLGQNSNAQTEPSSEPPAKACVGVDADGIPCVSPAVPYEAPSSSTTTVSPSSSTVTTSKKCLRYGTIEYVCGTEKRIEKVKVMDSYTTYHYEYREFLVEKKCTKPSNVCVEWEQ
jgi:hypothetical protein